VLTVFCRLHPGFAKHCPQKRVVQKSNRSPILHCLEHGSSLGWLIDPDERAVLVYPPGQQPQFLQKEQEILPVPHLVGDFELSVGQLFGWLKL
jgi:Uma2 family endonuclease